MWIYVPSFCYGEKRGFLYYVRLREKTIFCLHGTICVDVYALYIFFSAENI